MAVEPASRTSTLLEAVRESLRAYRRQQGLTEKAQAGYCRVSVSGFNDFMAGKYKGIDARMWDALYRAYPQLRWQLEEYNRQRALEGFNGALPPAETAHAPPGRRS